MRYNFKKIGKRIKDERKLAGYKSQDALCDYIGEHNYRSIKRQTLAKWENGEEMPPLDVLCTLCELFDCEVGYLLCEYDCKTRTKTDIHALTGLSDNAIDSLVQIKSKHELFQGHKKKKNDKLDIINLMLADKKNGLSSFLDILTGFCRFDVSNAENQMYTVDNNGITYFRGKETISGEGIYYNPKQAHFYLEDMESMYYLKIWDAIKEIKKEYCESTKAPGTS